MVRNEWDYSCQNLLVSKNRKNKNNLLRNDELKLCWNRLWSTDFWNGLTFEVLLNQNWGREYLFLWKLEKQYLPYWDWSVWVIKKRKVTDVSSSLRQLQNLNIMKLRYNVKALQQYCSVVDNFENLDSRMLNQSVIRRLAEETWRSLIYLEEKWQQLQFLQGTWWPLKMYPLTVFNALCILLICMRISLAAPGSFNKWKCTVVNFWLVF